MDIYHLEPFMEVLPHLLLISMGYFTNMPQLMILDKVHNSKEYYFFFKTKYEGGGGGG